MYWMGLEDTKMKCMLCYEDDNCTDPRHIEYSEQWCKLFEEKHGEDYDNAILDAMFGTKSLEED